MHRIILLRWLQLPGVISNHLLLLHQNCTNALKRGVAEHLVRFGIIRRNQYWSRGELLSDCVEGQLTLWRPSILHTSLKKTCERLSNLGEVLNEPSTVASKPKKASKLLRILRRLPFNNGTNFGWINFNALGRDNMPKINQFFQP